MGEQIYKKRMTSYYPPVIQKILEFQGIINSEYPEFELLKAGNERVISDAYLLTMSEQRIVQWEKYFNIQPLENATLDSRRNNIIARIRGQGKLNTNLIEAIVKSVSGGDCKCWIENSTLNVSLLPSNDNNTSFEIIVANIINELSRKVPAHLGLNVYVNPTTWKDINEVNGKWKIVNMTHNTWKDVLYGTRGKVNKLDYSTLDDFYLG